MIALKALSMSVRQSMVRDEFLPGRAEEDAAKDDDQYRCKNERVQWHFMFRVNLGEEATRWKAPISKSTLV